MIPTMKFIHRHNPLWPVLLAFAAAIGYVVTATQLGWYQRIPFVSLALLVIAVSWLVLGLREKRTVMRFAGLVLTLFVAAVFSWWTLSLSEYDNDTAAVANGDVVADLTEMELPDHAGLDRPVLAKSGATLLVLYRGHW